MTAMPISRLRRVGPTAPAAGVGWFWTGQNRLPVTIYAVDENGGGYDWDGDGVWE